jgi:beta-1,4-mannosyltransferase
MNISSFVEKQQKKIKGKNNTDKTTVHKKVTVYFAPQFLSINPYQKQLAEALVGLNLQVEGIEGRQVFLPAAVKVWSSSIVHLHWLHNYFRAPEFNKFPVLRFLRLPAATFTLIRFILGLIILKFAGIKIVWTAHNLASHETLFPKLDYLCRFVVAHISDSIIAHCGAAKNEIIVSFKIKDIDKIHVINHGHYINYYENLISKDDARKSLGLNDDSLVFLFLGLIRPYKGVLELIEAFMTLDNPDKQLIIAGKVTSQGVNKTFAEQVQLKSKASSQITYAPEFVSDSRIQIYMNACDVVVFPYRDVLTSGAVILAMSFGKPCIAPRKGCIGEALDNNGAFLYDPTQDYGLAHAMDQAVTNKAALPDMGDHNKQATKAWDWDVIAQQTSLLYLQCLDS